MTPTESLQLAQEYTSKLKERIGENLIKSILFGSRARSEQDQNSDFDLLLVVKNRDSALRNTVIDTEIEMLNKYDLLFASIIYEPHEWEQEQKFPFGWNVIRDGIEL